MYAYDRLLMPPRFWADTSSTDAAAGEARRIPVFAHRGNWLVRRPPSSSAWIIYQNMQRTWWGLFTPATVLMAGALLVLTVALSGVSWGWTLAVCLSLVAGVGGLIAWFRPVIGSED